MKTETYLGIIIRPRKGVARISKHKRSCDPLQGIIMCSILPLSLIQNIIKKGANWFYWVQQNTWWYNKGRCSKLQDGGANTMGENFTTTSFSLKLSFLLLSSWVSRSSVLGQWVVDCLTFFQSRDVGFDGMAIACLG